VKIEDYQLARKESMRITLAFCVVL
jgi:hypothetical protein